MQSLLLGRPRRSSIATHAEPHRRRRYHDVGPGRMRADLMNVAVDIDRRPPGAAGISRARNPADMDVGQKRGTIARCRHRTNPERRPHHLAVDDRRSRVPLIAAGYGIKFRQRMLRAVRIDAQDACVLGSDKNVVPNWYTARKFEVALCDLRPFAVGGPSAKRMPTDDCEHSSTFVGRQTANRSIADLVTNRVAGDTE